MAKITRTNILKPVVRSSHQKDHLQYESSNIYFIEIMTYVNLFIKLIKCQGQKVRYQQKDLTCIKSYIQVKYQNSCTIIYIILLAWLKFQSINRVTE